MEVYNCKMCGRLFNYIGGARLCPQCREQLEAKFHDVKQYIYEHKNASITEVSEEMKVPVTQIKKWVREERLALSDAMGEIECENCGKAIKTGKYCDDCKKKMTNMLESTYKKKENNVPDSRTSKDARARMRFLDK